MGFLGQERKEIQRGRKAKKKERKWKESRKEGRDGKKKGNIIPPLWYLSVTCACAGGMTLAKTDCLITSSALYLIHALIIFLVVSLPLMFLYFSTTFLSKDSLQWLVVSPLLPSATFPFACHVLTTGFCLKTPSKVLPHDLKTYSLLYRENDFPI